MPSFTFAATAHAAAWAGGIPRFAECRTDDFAPRRRRRRRAPGRRRRRSSATHVFGAPCHPERVEALARCTRRARGLRRRPRPGRGPPRATRRRVRRGRGVQPEPDQARRGRRGRARHHRRRRARRRDPHRAATTATRGRTTRRSSGSTPGCRSCTPPSRSSRCATSTSTSPAGPRSSPATAHCWPPCPGSRRSTLAPDDESTHKDFTVVVDEAAFGVDRDTLVAALRAEGIDTRCYFSPPVHRHTAYRPPRAVDLPRTDWLAARVISLPLWRDLDASGRGRHRRRSRASIDHAEAGQLARSGVRALVTGGAGFIGSHLVDALLADGADVVVLDDLSTGSPDNVAPAAELVEGDVADPPPSPPLCAGCDVVFHLAARGSVQRSVEHPLETDRTNVGGHAQRALPRPTRPACGRVVLPSSSSVYGGAEHAADRARTQPLQPRSPYAVSKLAGEHYARVFADLHGLETVSLRYFNVFGPRQRADSQYAAVVPRFIDALLARPPARGPRRRPAEPRLHLRRRRRAGQPARRGRRPPSLCRGASTTSPAASRTPCSNCSTILAELLAVDVAPRHVEGRAGDIRHSHAAIDAAVRDLGYRPTVSLRDGLAEHGGLDPCGEPHGRERAVTSELGDRLIVADRRAPGHGRGASARVTSGCRSPCGPRAVGFHVVGFDTDPERVAALRAGTSYVIDVSDAELAAALDAGYPPTDRSGRSRRVRRRRDHGADAAPRRHPRPVPRRAGGARRGATRCGPAPSSCSSRRRTRARRTSWCGRSSSGRTAGPGATSSSATRRSGSTPATRPGGWSTRPRSCPASTTSRCVASRPSTGPSSTRSSSVASTGRGRARQAAREHVPARQHRPRQRAGDVRRRTSGIDIWNAIDAASTKPFGYMRFTPGPGVGGHCLPIDPSFLSWRVKRSARADVPLRRAGERRQRAHARLRRHPDHDAAQPGGPGGARQPHPRPRAELQGRGRRTGGSHRRWRSSSGCSPSAPTSGRASRTSRRSVGRSCRSPSCPARSRRSRPPTWSSCSSTTRSSRSTTSPSRPGSCSTPAGCLRDRPFRGELL